MATPDPETMADTLSGQLRDKLRIRRGDTLAEKLPRARTLLPRPVYRAAAEVARAAQRSAHPKLRKQVDLPSVEAAFHMAQTHLKGVDPKARRVDMMLGAAASLSVNLILLALGLIALLQVLPVQNP